MRAAYYISLGYRVNHKAGLYAGEIRQINNVSLLSVHRIQNLQPLYYKAQRSAIKDKKMKRAPLITGLFVDIHILRLCLLRRVWSRQH